MTTRVLEPSERALRARLTAQHRARHGDWCAGWSVPAHPAAELLAETVAPAVAGEVGSWAVLCRPCNSRKNRAPTAPEEYPMKITAKVRCNSRVHIDGEQDIVQFGADYLGEASEANAVWARYTPALAIQMNVRPEVPFEPGKSYTLTFDDGE